MLKTKEALEKELVELKKVHGIVRSMEVPLDSDTDEIATIFLSKPDNTVRSIVLSLADKNKTKQAVEACLKKLYIGGDDLNVILNSEDAVFSAESGVVELLAVQKAVLKKN